jgi:hypothetical protein
MSAEDMTNDLRLTVSADQSEFIPVVYQRFSGSPDLWIFLAMVIVVWGAGRLRARRQEREVPPGTRPLARGR